MSIIKNVTLKKLLLMTFGTNLVNTERKRGEEEAESKKM